MLVGECDYGPIYLSLYGMMIIIAGSYYVLGKLLGVHSPLSRQFQLYYSQIVSKNICDVAENVTRIKYGTFYQWSLISDKLCEIPHANEFELLVIILFLVVIRNSREMFMLTTRTTPNFGHYMILS